MDFHGTREADCFTCQPLDAGAEGPVVTFNALREDFAGQVFLLRHFSGVAAPVIAGHHATMPIQNGVNRANSSRQVSSFRGPKVESVSQHTASFSVVRIPGPVLLRLAANEAPLPIKFTDKGNISVSDWRRCYPPGRELFNVRMTVLMPIFSVLAV